MLTISQRHMQRLRRFPNHLQAETQKHHPIADHSASLSDPALCSAKRERRVISLSWVLSTRWQKKNNNSQKEISRTGEATEQAALFVPLQYTTTNNNSKEYNWLQNSLCSFIPLQNKPGKMMGWLRAPTCARVHLHTYCVGWRALRCFWQ